MPSLSSVKNWHVVTNCSSIKKRQDHPLKLDPFRLSFELGVTRHLDYRYNTTVVPRENSSWFNSSASKSARVIYKTLARLVARKVL